MPEIKHTIVPAEEFFPFMRAAVEEIIKGEAYSEFYAKS